MIDYKLFRIPRSKVNITEEVYREADWLYDVGGSAPEKKKLADSLVISPPRGGQKIRLPIAGILTVNSNRQVTLSDLIADLRVEILCGNTEKALDCLSSVESCVLDSLNITSELALDEAIPDFKTLISKSSAPSTLNCDFLFKCNQAKLFLRLACHGEKARDRFFVSSDQKDMPLSYSGGIIEIPSSADFFNLMHGRVSLFSLALEGKLLFKGNEKTFKSLVTSLM